MIDRAESRREGKGVGNLRRPEAFFVLLTPAFSLNDYRWTCVL
jgi:hypothetical protein